MPASSTFSNSLPTPLPSGTSGGGYAQDASYVDPGNLAYQAASAVMSGTLGYQQPAFAATLTVNAAAGSVVIVTLTGSITIAAPTSPVTGQHLQFVLTQDGTGGRTITYNAVFKVAGFAATTTTASTTTVDTFVYNGTNWIGVSRSTGN